MKLRTGYLLSGIATGCIILFSFFWTLPDGKLHIFFCDVGQGDGAYIRFADGRDMVVDGGPDDKIIGCLGRHMPFWDRHIDIVAMTHPQKDHMQGLISVFERYGVDYFVRSDVNNATTEGYAKLQAVVAEKHIPVKFTTAGESIAIGLAHLTFLWPSIEQIAKGKNAEVLAKSRTPSTGSTSAKTTAQVLGAAIGDLNDYCLVFHLRYGTFDAVLPGDADNHVEYKYVGEKLADDPIEVLKVPHHGSKTGMTKDFIEWIHPALAVISVGKNSYGHPTREALDLLASVGAKVMRTDQTGDIEVVSDGRSWTVKTHRNN